MIARSLRFLIPFAISAGLLILLVYFLGDQLSAIPGDLLKADWSLIPAAIALYFVGIWVRSVRWRLLLPEHSVKLFTLFRALVVGLTVNDVVPLRAGEVARAYLLARWCRIPYGTTVASLVVERVLDGLSLAVLLLIALTLVPSPPPYLLVGAVGATAIFVTAATLLALAAWRASAIMALAGFVGRRLPRRFGTPIERLASSFARALALVHSPARLARMLGLSLLAWGLELGVFFVVMLSFRLPASYQLALLVGSAANFSTLVPSSPGYAGTFDFALTRVLQDAVAIPIPTATAAAYDVVVHYAILILPVVVVGMLVLWRSHMTFGQITHTPERFTPQEAEANRQAA
ncbi:MAG TPA: lysylphosphatidylglycerol synthase transmembrane domain-containing protein [Chloroflexota bacterium]|nr:lysylphosphatidylglycerol synthase transmembrane domain-containing protein [Chloroflexota bacterium]